MWEEVKNVANKLKKDSELKRHYALRKVGKDLLSVSVGLFFATFINERQLNQVKATVVPDHSQISQIKSNQEVVQFGKIIPVDAQGQAIPNAPTPVYRRDPQDPNKAIATPAPEIKDYELSKENQVENYDPETNMVIPPANPQENTELVYILKNPEKPIVPPENPSKPDEKPTKPSQPSTPSQPTQNTKPNANYPHVNNRPSNNVVSKPVEKPNQNNYQTYPQNPNITTSTTTTTSTYQSSVSNAFQAGNYASSNANQANVVESSAQTNGQAAEVSGAQGSERKEDKATEHKKSKNKSKKTVKKERHPAKKVEQKPTKKKSESKKREPLPNLHQSIPPVIIEEKPQLPPKPSLATLEIKDEENDNVLQTLEAEGNPGEPVGFVELANLLTEYQRKGYEIAYINKEGLDKHINYYQTFPFGFYGEKDSKFTLFLAHHIVAISINNLPSGVPAELVKKSVSEVIRYEGAGSQTPAEHIQNAVWTRTLTLDQVTHELIHDGKFNSPWKAQPLAYQEVVSPEIEGYTASPAIVDKIPVTRRDIIKTVVYEKKVTAEEIAPQLVPQEEIPKKLDRKIPEEKTIMSQELTEKETSGTTKNSVATVTFLPHNYYDRKTESEEKAPVEKLSSNKKKEIEEKEEQEFPVTSQDKKMNASEKDDDRLETRIFLTEDGEKLRSDQRIERLSNFPVFDHYYLQHDVHRNGVHVATYGKIGKIIPVDEYGNLIVDPNHPQKAVAERYFENDPHNPRKVLQDQPVPDIEGWRPSKPVVSPEDPGIDIPVLYSKQKSDVEKGQG